MHLRAQRISSILRDGGWRAAVRYDAAAGREIDCRRRERAENGAKLSTDSDRSGAGQIIDSPAAWAGVGPRSVC